MPTQAEHLGKAAHNERLASTLGNPFWDWAVTAKFYSALHLVEAYLGSKMPAKHSGNHHSRNRKIQDDPVLRALYPDYRELEEASRDARYEASLTFSQADAQRLDKNLDQIKKVLPPLLT